MIVIIIYDVYVLLLNKYDFESKCFIVGLNEKKFDNWGILLVIFSLMFI